MMHIPFYVLPCEHRKPPAILKYPRWLAVQVVRDRKDTRNSR